MFLFDLPDLRSIVNQDIIMSYLRHFIQMYHEPTRIKSDLDRKVDL